VLFAAEAALQVTPLLVEYAHVALFSPLPTSVALAMSVTLAVFAQAFPPPLMVTTGVVLSSFTVVSPKPILPALSEARNFTVVTPSLVIVTWLFEAKAALQVVPLLVEYAHVAPFTPLTASVALALTVMPAAFDQALPPPLVVTAGIVLSSFTVVSPKPILPVLSTARNFTVVTPSLLIVTWLFEAEAALQVVPLLVEYAQVAPFTPLPASVALALTVTLAAFDQALPPPFVVTAGVVLSSFTVVSPKPILPALSEARNFTVVTPSLVMFTWLFADEAALQVVPLLVEYAHVASFIPLSASVALALTVTLAAFDQVSLPPLVVMTGKILSIFTVVSPPPTLPALSETRKRTVVVSPLVIVTWLFEAEAALHLAPLLVEYAHFALFTPLPASVALALTVTLAAFDHIPAPPLAPPLTVMTGGLLSSFTVVSPKPTLPTKSETRNFTVVLPSLVMLTWLFEAEAALQVAPLSVEYAHVESSTRISSVALALTVRLAAFDQVLLPETLTTGGIESNTALRVGRFPTLS
jgi:hypothetical protein